MSAVKKPLKKTPKKAPEKAPARKAAPKKEAVRKEAPARKKAAAKPEPKPGPPPAPPREARKEKPRKRRPASRAAAPTGVASSKPGLGSKWTCYHCQVKFYDLNKPVPLCPKCGSDQRDAPRVAPTPPPPEPPRPREKVAAMPASLLDEDEATVEDFEADGAEFDIGPLDDETEPEGDEDFLGAEEPLEEEASDEE